MKKQNNFVAKHNHNRASVHKDKSKGIPRDMKYEDKDIQEFVDEIHSDGKRPCEYFGMSAEELGEIEDYYEKLIKDHKESMESGVVSVPDHIQTADEFYEWIMSFKDDASE